MKRLSCFVFLTTLIVTFGVSQDLEMYTYLYNSTESISDRLDILRRAEAANLSDSDEFFANALARLLLEYPNTQVTRERAAADETARFLANALGDRNYTAAAGNLWKTVKVFSNPLVKADSLVALGRVGAVDYLPQVLQTLHDVNAHPTPDPTGGERIAFGATLALENYPEIPEALRREAAAEVYLVYRGWYSDRVQNQAAVSLKTISPDPSEPYISIIQGSSYSYANKYQALQDLDIDPDASVSVKSAVAVSALAEGWRLSSDNLRSRGILTNIRKLAIRMINHYHTDDPKAYPLLERSYRYGTDTQEKIDTTAALASLATDEAVELLSSFLMIINGRQQIRVVTETDQQMARALISALGTAGNPQGRPALNVVLSINWNEAVKRLANENLSKLQ